MTAERDFPLNQWYCASFADEVTGKPLARTICDRQIVLYRDTAAKVVALTNRCPHRKAPLTDGQMIGDNLERPFHGMLFSPAGSCLDIPSQIVIPTTAHIRPYPVGERYGHVWLWMDDSRPDLALVLDMHWMTDPALSEVHGLLPIACDYLAALDNLLDDTHLNYAGVAIEWVDSEHGDSFARCCREHHVL